MNHSINYTPDQLKWLRNQGIQIKGELESGSVLCVTYKGERIYTARNLEQIAVPGLMDRLTAFMGVRHESRA